MTTLPPWRPLLSAAREREGRSAAARWLQLATVAADGTPRVRTLVFRGWAEGAALDLLTDGRSAKPAELAQQAAVELCWLLPRARCQFRLRGMRQTLAPELEQRERLRHWLALTPGGRALWGWPTTRRCRIISSCCAWRSAKWNCWNSQAIRTAVASGGLRAAGRSNA